MNINRNNYEEYFLLYTDNELGEEERKAVERFVEENPDLKNELLGFQDAVLHADTEVRFPGKKELLSSNASLSIINNDNYTEYFLLYGDNELSNEEKAQVEQYVYHNPELQEEFELFLAVKVEPDRSIIFENKESLMKQPAGGRVIAGWLKFTASVAAALIFLVFGYLKYNAENDVENDPIVSQNIEKNAPVKRKPLITIENKIDTPDQIISPDENNQAQQQAVVTPQTTSQLPARQTEKEVRTSVAQKQAAGLSQDNRTEKKQPAEKNPVTVRVEDKIAVPAPKEIEVATLPRETDQEVAISVDHVQSLHQENLQLKAPVIVAKNERETAGESDFSIAGFPVTSNSKVGNIISRTSRFINKTKKEISTKSEKVLGNFEIAIR